MGVSIAAVISKAIEGAETVSKVNAMKETVAEAEEIAKGLWPEIEKQDASQAMSVGDIAKEAWAKLSNDDAESLSNTPRYIITINESLENDRHPITGVPFERKIIELPGGERIEGVFPNFESVFDARIPEDLYLRSDTVQFKECNRQLMQEIERNPSLRNVFTEEQLEQIRDGISDGSAPDGYVWNHDAEPGKIQLVDSETHMHTGHTGGRYLWGGGSDCR